MARRVPPAAAALPASPLGPPQLGNAPGSRVSAGPAPAPPRSRVRVTLVGTTTALRLALTPLVAALALAGQDIAAAVTFAVAAGTDYLDGVLARRWHVTTTTGSFLDTTADKVLVAGVLITLTSIGQASPWAVMIIVCRELIVMGLRGSVAVQGRVIRASQLGRTKAAAQFLAILLLLLRVDTPVGPTGVAEWVLWLAALLTVTSAGNYLYRWAGVTLREPKPAALE
ncbi:MAG TPA: CDP-diacylglycerol--glycerol-3-phosphate 3-phosphatidyltransferase [Candidatus Binatia bacterium]|nr:CDP-diacylglycerol--glycerol-3-phosphate 3-phosphatidyltransferase [Candidatus Binatia bacterium]